MGRDLDAGSRGPPALIPHCTAMLLVASHSTLDDLGWFEIATVVMFE